ncbi:MAG TPA: ABC-2 family transporter protein [Acidimicrobiales bacterium]|nr:ABC-2 family transporter protein [Acidimicrobiales bacterium]
MAHRLPLHWAVARRSFRRYSTYRGATFARVFTNTVFGFIQAYVLLAVIRERSVVGGFDAGDVVTFTFVCQGLLAAIAGFGPFELADRITSGDVVSDLYRPLDLQSWWIAQDAGRAGFQLVFRGIPPFAVAATVFELRLPADAGVWVAFLVSLALGVAVAFAWRFAICLSAFWLVDARGMVQLSGLVFIFFSGMVLPLAFFPSGLRALADALPFAAVVQLPAEVFLSKHRSLEELVPVLVRQAAWLAALAVAGRLILSRAWRRVVVQGG